METIEDRLYARNRRRRLERMLPAFAAGAIRLGRELHLAAERGEPRLAVVIVPVREYFSLFLALGAAEATLTCRRMQEARIDKGQPVIALNRDGSYYTAVYEGEQESTVLGERVELSVLQLRGNKRILLNPDTATLFQVSEAQAKRLGDFQARTLPAWLNNVMAAYGLANRAQMLGEHEPSVSVVGTKSILEEELSDKAFGLTHDDAELLSLNDLLLITRDGITSPIAEVVPSTGSRSGTRSVPLKVLDGANVVLRHGLDSDGGSLAVVMEASTPAATLELATGLVYNATVFAEPDLGWSPFKHAAFRETEWSVHRLGERR